jgi:hypothetical protein
MNQSKFEKDKSDTSLTNMMKKQPKEVMPIQTVPYK